MNQRPILEDHLQHYSKANKKLCDLIMALAGAAKLIHRALNAGNLGLAGTTNSSGDEQSALDVVADQIIFKSLKDSRLVSHVASEEREKETALMDHPKADAYSVAYDPLDGSSMVKANLAVGSIFSIFKTGSFVGRSGREQVAALYAIYGPRTTLVYSTGNGVHEFALDDDGDFCLIQNDIRINEKTDYFSPGNLRAAKTNPKYRTLIDHYIQKGYTLRYSGGMVADLNITLLRGEGIYLFPPHPPKYPEGRLRLLFECNPLAYLFNQAGGMASDGTMDILDITIKDIHQRVAIYIGSAEEVKKVVDAMK